jgi:hypothetical protein
MRALNPNKLAELSTFNDLLDEKFGKQGTPERERFNKESLVWVDDNMSDNCLREPSND